MWCHEPPFLLIKNVSLIYPLMDLINRANTSVNSIRLTVSFKRIWMEICFPITFVSFLLSHFISWLFVFYYIIHIKIDHGIFFAIKNTFYVKFHNSGKKLILPLTSSPLLIFFSLNDNFNAGSNKFYNNNKFKWNFK